MCVVWVFTHLIPLKLLITLWNKDRNYYPYSIEKESLRLQDNLLTTGLWGGFPGGTVVKPLPASAGDARDAGSIPGSARPPGEGDGNPLQYSCLRYPLDRRAWRATVHRATESVTTEHVGTHDWGLSSSLLSLDLHGSPLEKFSSSPGDLTPFIDHLQAWKTLT